MNTLSMDSITDLFRFDVFCRRLDWVPRFLEGFLLCLRNFGDLCGLRDTKVMFGTQLKVYTERGILTLKSLVPGRFKWNFRWVILKLILVIDGWGISCEIALKCMPVDLIDDKAALVQAMAWCRQATSHYLSQCWPRSMSPYGVTWPRWVNVWCLFDTKQYLYLLSYMKTDDTGIWYPFSSKTRAHLSYTVNTMAADELVMQGARASTGMVLT